MIKKYKYYELYNKLIIFIADERYNQDNIINILKYFINEYGFHTNNINLFVSLMLQQPEKCYISLEKRGNIFFGKISLLDTHLEIIYDKIHYDNEVFNNRIKYLLINGNDGPSYKPKILVYD